MVQQDQSVLRNYERWRGSLNDFSWLDNVTTGASDIDQGVERQGWVLFFEGKPVIDGTLRIPTGQHRMFETLGRPRNQQLWVVGAEGKLADSPISILRYDGNPQPQHDRRRIMLGGRGVWHVVFPVSGLHTVDLDGLRDFVAAWWSWCGDNPFIFSGSDL